jgi:hypothetical protein
MEVLELTDTDDGEVLKRKYRAKLLKSHPDKNPHPLAAEQFREVQEAYSFLLDKEEEDDGRPPSYDDALSDFLSGIHESPILKMIIVRLGKLGVEYLSKVNRSLLLVLRAVLLKYGDVLHLPVEMVEKINELLNIQECIVLNPTLDDLLSDENVYKLKHDDRVFLVPLWHHETVFDCGGRELIVRCHPILPENMEIDEQNMLTVNLEYYVDEIWEQTVDVWIGSRVFSLDSRELKLTGGTQQIILYGCGIPYNNPADILKCDSRQNIVLEIGLGLRG